MANHELLTASTFLVKGGVGKTTITAHTGVALGREGYDVLLVDLAGKQGDLAKSFGIYEDLTDNAWPNISTVFKPEWENVVSAIGEDNVLLAPPDADYDSLVVETDEGVDLIPAHEGLDSIDTELGNKFDGLDRYTRLDSFLSEFVAPNYDVCLLDLPGNTNNVSINGVFASENVIAPVQAGSFEATQVESLQDDLKTIREEYGRDARLTMLVPNMIDYRTTLATEYAEQFDEDYADELAPIPIPRSQDIVNAQERGQTIFALEEPSRTAERAREAFEINAEELVTRIQGIPA